MDLTYEPACIRKGGVGSSVRPSCHAPWSPCFGGNSSCSRIVFSPSLVSPIRKNRATGRHETVWVPRYAPSCHAAWSPHFGGNSSCSRIAFSPSLVPPIRKNRATGRHENAETGLRANTFTPWTPYLRAVRSLEVARKQSKRAVIRTSSRPIWARYLTSSASGSEKVTGDRPIPIS